MSGVLKLKEVSPLAKGHSRLVYQHPEEPAYLVKVIRPEVIEKRWGSGTAWYKRRRRYGRFISYVREIQEYVAVCARHGECPDFLQKIIGFAETDLGLGLVIEAVRDREGNLAPTLGSLVRAGRFDAVAKAALERFMEQLLGCDATVSDLNVGNLVYCDAASEARFVMIDGLGSAAVLPLAKISRRFNRRSKLGRYDRLRSRIARLQAAAAAPVS